MRSAASRPASTSTRCPGQVFYDASRKLILKGVDGVVFVADSQIERMEANIESLENLRTNLPEQGYDLDKLPYVVQYNKRDLPNAAPVDELRELLNPTKVPDFEAVRHQRRRRVRHAQGRRQARPDRAEARAARLFRATRHRSRGRRYTTDLRMAAAASECSHGGVGDQPEPSRTSGTKRTSTAPVMAANSSAPATPKAKPARAGRSRRTP